MTEPLICSRCGQEIKPGTKVEMIGLEEGQHVYTDDDMIVVHAKCPDEDAPKATR